MANETNIDETTEAAKDGMDDIKDTTTNVEPSKQETKPDIDKAERDSEDTEESDLDHWKRMSRKNENDFKKAAKAVDNLNAQLAEANLTIARMNAQREHPQITDEMFERLCSADTPDGVAEWAAAFAGLVPEPKSDNHDENKAAEEKNPEGGKPAECVSSMADIRAGLQANMRGGGRFKGAAESEEDGRKIARKFAEQRLERANRGASSVK